MKPQLDLHCLPDYLALEVQDNVTTNFEWKFYC